MRVIGLDVGTQSTKALVVDIEAGRVVARGQVSYGLIGGLPAGAAEQHPDTWWRAVGQVLHELGGAAREVAAVGVSGQQHGLVVLDQDGQVVRPAKLWCDTVTATEAAELSAAFGRRVPTGFTASKILWLARHEPAAWARVRTVLLPHDFINFRLTGRRVMEAGDASGTGFFDPVQRTFVAKEMAAIDRRLPELIPPLVAPGEPAGVVTAAAAAELGLRAGIPVAAGGGDNMMSALGAGATRPGILVVSLGTSGTIFGFSDRPVVDPDGLIAPFCDSTGGWLPLLCVMNATGVLEEVRAAFPGSTLEALTEEAARLDPGAGGLMLVPYLSGERVPDLPAASGCLFGLRPGSLRPGPLFRAALEGVTHGLCCGLERLTRLGVSVSEVRLAGGGSRSVLWRQILADALGSPVHLVEEPESAALGAAIAAAWTARRVGGEAVCAGEVAASLVKTRGPAIEPDAASGRIYRQERERFRQLVERLYGIRP
jgi:xylulokinase